MKKSIIEKEKTKKYLKEILGDIILVLLIVFIFTKVVLIGFVSSSSMEPTLMTGDFVIYNCLSYISGKPQRGDIIVIDYEDNGEKLRVTKRVIGLPGENVSFKDGKVYVDGELLQEPYLKENEVTYALKNFNVPLNSYIVLGDNRMNSWDSRFWDEPYIVEDKIIAKYMWHM